VYGISCQKIINIIREVDGNKFLSIYELKWMMLKREDIFFGFNIGEKLKVSDTKNSERGCSNKEVST
jgi:hypothetical protein